MSETKPGGTKRSRRMTLGELIALRLLLRSIDENIRNAMTAENAGDRRSAHMVALNQLNIALELTKDNSTHDI